MKKLSIIKQMLKATLLTILVVLNSYDLYSQTQLEDAQDATLTDLDGNTETIYELLAQNYVVILMHGNNGACWQSESIELVMDSIWNLHGPDGENTLRMFYFDVEQTALAPDENVMEYTQEWGIDYPVINLANFNSFSDYPESGYPTVYYICPDRNYVSSGGYGYPYSTVESFLNVESCLGSNLDSNLTLFSATQPLASTLCNSTPLLYTPTLTVVESQVVTNYEDLSMNPFNVEILINGQFFQTQNINPSENGGNESAYYYFPTLEPIAVELGDTLTFILSISGDNFADDDTLVVVMPTEVSTPSSTDSSLTVVGPTELYFEVFNSEGEAIYSSSGFDQFTLLPDSCYSIQFLNSNVYGGLLKDQNGIEVISYEAEQYDGSKTPRLYFHVSNTTVGIDEPLGLKHVKIVNQYIVDGLGKKHAFTDLHTLPEGVYFEIQQFEDGSILTKKLFNKH